MNQWRVRRRGWYPEVKIPIVLNGRRFMTFSSIKRIESPGYVRHGYIR